MKKDYIEKFYSYYKDKCALPPLFRGNNYDLFEKTKPPEYHEYRRKWTEVSKDQQILEFPLHISIDTNNSCNLRCPMCPRAFDMKKSTKFKNMPFDLYRKIIDEAASNNLSALRLNKKNEPTMTKSLAKYVAYAKKRGIVDIMINTNAVYLSKELGAELIEAGLDKLNISVDSHIKEEYEATRIGTTFERVLENIKNFFALRQEMGSITPLIRISRITKYSECEQLNSFIDFWKPYCDEIILTNYVNYNARPSLFKENNVPQGFVLEMLGICPQPWQRLEISADGNVYCCCMDSDEMLLGSIHKTSLKHMWCSERINQVRDSLARKGPFSRPTCSWCYASMYFTDA